MTFIEFRRLLSNLALASCVLLILLFAGDYLLLRYRFAVHGIGGVTARVTTYDAALMKDNKYSVFGDQPLTETCVRSIFPWLGLHPCWYVRRHEVKVLNGETSGGRNWEDPHPSQCEGWGARLKTPRLRA